MGRDAGWLQRLAARRGRDMIIIPEEPTDLETICNHVLARRARAGFSIIVVSEAAVITDISDEGIDLVLQPYGRVVDRRNIGERLAAEIEGTGLETRFIVLGYLQRGGAPQRTDHRNRREWRR